MSPAGWGQASRAFLFCGPGPGGLRGSASPCTHRHAVPDAPGVCLGPPAVDSLSHPPCRAEPGQGRRGGVASRAGRGGVDRGLPGPSACDLLWVRVSISVSLCARPSACRGPTHCPLCPPPTHSPQLASVAPLCPAGSSPCSAGLFPPGPLPWRGAYGAGACATTVCGAPGGPRPWWVCRRPLWFPRMPPCSGAGLWVLGSVASVAVGAQGLRAAGAAGLAEAGFQPLLPNTLLTGGSSGPVRVLSRRSPPRTRSSRPGARGVWPG